MAARSTTRALGMLLLCAALGATTLAATSGKRRPAPVGPAAKVVAAARALVGEPYRWGAAGPHAFDCSGLTSRLWRHTGGVAAIPRTSAQQQAWTIPIPRSQAVIGDLVFFGAPVTHVGLITQRSRDGRLQMVDASASRGRVVERRVWTSGVIRFGRVPRPSAPAVRPWRAGPAAVPRGPLVSPSEPLLAGKAPLAGLPRTQAHPSSPAMLRFATYAKRQLGATTWTDTRFVTALWRRAGGAASPDSRRAITNRTHRVLLRDARVGDLVSYGPPGSHVAVYVGGGWMISDSQRLGKVVRRPVWAADDVHVLRWDR